MAWSSKKRLLVTCSIGWAVTILGVILIPIVEYAVKKIIEHTVVIREGGKVYQYWVDPPVPIFMQIYMFNLTNPSEFLAGEKPALQQVGPYTYKERRFKYDIVWNDNGTVTYRQNRTFHFLSNMSVGMETDVFLTPNPVFWTLFNALKWEDGRVREAINFLIRVFNQGPLMTRPIREIVWGYKDPLISIAKTIDPRWFYTDYIGYMMNKNNTNDGVYTVFTGETDITKLSMIDKYNGTKLLDFWSTKYANMINGSDGSVGPPYMQKGKLMYTFASDVCRSVAGEYFYETESSQGIPLWRYSAPQSFMANATVNPDNAGFCVPKGHCLETGVFNITVCQTMDYFTLPAILSLPHFLYGDKKLVNSVTGLSPNVEEHLTYVDVEPYTGLVLRAAKRLQFNMYLEPLENVSETEHITPVYFPAFWLNESAAIDDANAKTVINLLIVPLKVVHGVEITIICAGVLILLASIVYGVRKYRLAHLQLQGAYREAVVRYGAIDNDTSSILGGNPHQAIDDLSANDVGGAANANDMNGPDPHV